MFLCREWRAEQTGPNRRQIRSVILDNDVRCEAYYERALGLEWNSTRNQSVVYYTSRKVGEIEHENAKACFSEYRSVCLVSSGKQHCLSESVYATAYSI